MFDPGENLPLINKNIVYFGACLIAGMRLARESHLNVRTLPILRAIDESVDLAREIYDKIFRKVPEWVTKLPRLDGQQSCHGSETIETDG